MMREEALHEAEMKLRADQSAPARAATLRDKAAVRREEAAARELDARAGLWAGLSEKVREIGPAAVAGAVLGPQSFGVGSAPAMAPPRADVSPAAPPIVARGDGDNDA